MKHQKFYSASLQADYVQYTVNEFLTYLRWAAEDMNNLYFSHTVENIDFDKKTSIVSGANQPGRIFCPQYLPWYRKNNLIYHPV
ncbi:lysine N(6)-hydroxylase/L-ornithine N(5)-oxygenase family protein [Escherichia coli]|nr:lysine N(6)-hydroxylase/L-ornithine N(5)-oxygenase family protein [Escherichia coli]